MAVIELKIPNLGESISSVTFAKWLKPDGSTVTMDEPLCEIETEKANQELSADSAGKLIWVAKEGEDLAVGAVFAKIDTEASGAADAGSNAKTEKPAVTPAATPSPTPSKSSCCASRPATPASTCRPSPAS